MIDETSLLVRSYPASSLMFPASIPASMPLNQPRASQNDILAAGFW